MNASKIITHWNQIRSGLIDTIDKFNRDALDYVPVEDGYSVREIILHIAQEEFGEIQYGLTRKIDAFPPPYRVDDFPSIESLKALLLDVHYDTNKYLESLHDTDLNLEFEAQWGETKPLIEFILHVIEHEVHHRGELSLILGLLGQEGLDA
jgi:uncharacterized damage-inducible protein DinB